MQFQISPHKLQSTHIPMTVVRRMSQLCKVNDADVISLYIHTDATTNISNILRVTHIQCHGYSRCYSAAIFTNIHLKKRTRERGKAFRANLIIDHIIIP